MSKIGTQETERLARLARIGLTAEETAKFTVELGDIVEFVEQLQSAKAASVEPTDQVAGLENVMRPDEVQPAAQSREQLLANVPEQQDGYIKVKRVLE